MSDGRKCLLLSLIAEELRKGERGAILLNRMSATTVARLKITLDDVSPVILRRVEVPFDIRLDRLHLTVQAAMGWTNSHLYEIRAGDVGFSTPDPDGVGEVLDAGKARFNDVLQDMGTKKLVYLYDFGDGWEHTIRIEQLADPEPGVLYPCRRLLTGFRRTCRFGPVSP